MRILSLDPEHLACTCRRLNDFVSRLGFLLNHPGASLADAFSRLPVVAPAGSLRDHVQPHHVNSPGTRSDVDHGRSTMRKSLLPMLEDHVGEWLPRLHRVHRARLFSPKFHSHWAPSTSTISPLTPTRSTRSHPGRILPAQHISSYPIPTVGCPTGAGCMM